MEKIQSFSLALEYLKQQEILVSFQKGNKVLYCMKKEKIQVQSKNAAYVLTIEDFQDLFEKEVFYLYEPNDSGFEISKEKDEEYYGWYHK